ncbi:hypothetical protein [Lactococcus garvieae]
MKLYDGNGKNVGEIYNDNSCCGCIFIFFIIFVVGGVLLSILKVILPFLLMILLIAGVLAALFFLTKTPKSKNTPVVKSNFNDEIEVIDDVTVPNENFNESKPTLKNEFIVIEYCETKKEPRENSETTGHFGKGTIINVESEVNNWAKFYNYSNEERYIKLKSR